MARTKRSINSKIVWIPKNIRTNIQTNNNFDGEPIIVNFENKNITILTTNGLSVEKVTTDFLKKHKWRLTREARSNNRLTPNRDYRKIREKELRDHNKRELRKFLNQPECDAGVFRNKPASHLRDWA